MTVVNIRLKSKLMELLQLEQYFDFEPEIFMGCLNFGLIINLTKIKINQLENLFSLC